MSHPPAVREATASAWRETVKRVLPGRMVAAAWRRRRTPLQTARAHAADRTDRRHGRVPPPGPRRREVRSVVCTFAGPGELDALLDSAAALKASDGDASQLLVVDDCSVDSRAAVLHEHLEGVDVLRTRYSTGGPPNLWELARMGLEQALDRYSFEQWVKMDTDALCVGPGLSRRTLSALAETPDVGIAGSFRMRADGRPEDHVYHAKIIGREIARNRMLAAGVERAEAAGWRRGDAVQGGCMCITRSAAQALRDQGWLGWSRPWHSLLAEELVLTLFIRAAGFEAVSLGGPDDGLLAVANKGLPLSKEELADGRWVGAHSVRHGVNGESEAELRSFFAARRAGWLASSPARHA